MADIGASIITPTDSTGARARAHNAAFTDHWGSSVGAGDVAVLDRTVQRKQFSTLAVDEDGAVLAYVMVSQWVPREAYVDLVGTVREARGRGLAAAALGRSIRLAAESGEFDVIELGVDSDSPTGATRLYERLGFTLARVMAAMQKDPEDQSWGGTP